MDSLKTSFSIENNELKKKIERLSSQLEDFRREKKIKIAHAQ